jgi:hypothetical protein
MENMAILYLILLDKLVDQLGLDMHAVLLLLRFHRMSQKKLNKEISIDSNRTATK